MFQITVSTIHERAEDSRHDSDGCVSYISDQTTAILAALKFAGMTGEALGIKFTVDAITDEDSPLVMVASAEAPHLVTGPAKVYINVSAPQPLSDIERIADLLRINQHYTHGVPPEDSTQF